jgi:NOL1/NOP2/fmu family ribosome biogenesis protein
MEIIHSSEKKQILKQLNEQFGIEQVPQALLKFGKEKIRMYSGNLTADELKVLDNTLRIENIGLYFIKKENELLRINLDALTVLNNQIKKNILDINDEQTKQWFMGQDLEIKSDNAYKILRNNNQFIGCGKSTGDRIVNFMPKERRIK